MSHSRLDLLFVVHFPFVSRLPTQGDGQGVARAVGGGQGVRCHEPEHCPSLTAHSQIELSVLRFARSDSSLLPSRYLVFACACARFGSLGADSLPTKGLARTSSPADFSVPFCSYSAMEGFMLAWHRSGRSLLHCAYAGINSVLGLSLQHAAWLVCTRSPLHSFLMCRSRPPLADLPFDVRFCSFLPGAVRACPMQNLD
jgi:hypothetical protein